MKNILVVLFCVATVISCKNESKSNTQEKNDKEEQSEPLTLLTGEFIYYDGAAVLQTSTEIYGVYINDKMSELNKQAEKFKKLPTDMVPVEIKGRISNKKDDKILWEKKVDIIEIINVSKPKTIDNNVVKLGKE